MNTAKHDAEVLEELSGRLGISYLHDRTDNTSLRNIATRLRLNIHQRADAEQLDTMRHTESIIEEAARNLLKAVAQEGQLAATVAAEAGKLKDKLVEMEGMRSQSAPSDSFIVHKRAAMHGTLAKVMEYRTPEGELTLTAEDIVLLMEATQTWAHARGFNK